MRRLILLAALLPALAACDDTTRRRDAAPDIAATDPTAAEKARAQAELDAVARRVLEDRVARLEADMAVVMARMGAAAMPPPLADPALGAAPPPLPPTAVDPPAPARPEAARQPAAPPLRYDLN